MYVSGAYLSTIRTLRSGAVIITRGESGDPWFLLAKHPSGDLGDFGGGVKKGETAMDAARRELEEETNGLSKEMLPPNFDFDSALGLVTTTTNRPDIFAMAILFFEVDPKWLHKAHPRFLELSETNRDRSTQEISDVVWVDRASFEELVFGDTVAASASVPHFYSFRKEVAGPVSDRGFSNPTPGNSLSGFSPSGFSPSGWRHKSDGASYQSRPRFAEPYFPSEARFSTGKAYAKKELVMWKKISNFLSHFPSLVERLSSGVPDATISI